MLNKIKGFFSGEHTLEESVQLSLETDKSGEVTTHDLHVATAVILVQVASSDEAIAREEAEAVCGVIEENLGISQELIPSLVETAVAARRQKGKIDDFINLINDRFSTDQRRLLLAMVWKIVLADNKIEKLEERMVIQLRNRLRLTFEDGQQAREMAETNKV
ncbi:MAG: TerB family tellurite resistance protein [Deltaproteobacteria bacterium]|nr:TerB family tellurite resistance protein [Deltaproteobacteria bacterium]